MGNIICASLKRTLEDPQISEALQEISQRRFGAYFRIHKNPKYGIWEFFAPDLQFHGKVISFPVWSWERQSPRRIGGKYPRPAPRWINWAWWQFLVEMTLRFGGCIINENEKGISPNPYANESFLGYLDRHLREVRSDFERQRIQETRLQLAETLEQRFELVPPLFHAIAFPQSREKP